MVDLQTITWMSEKTEQFHNITEEVHHLVENSIIKNGMVLVVPAHATARIMLNEGVSHTEIDMKEALTRLVPLDADYSHAHFLSSYDDMEDNSDEYTKSLLCGNHCVLPVMDGKIVCESEQDIYIAEFNGPQTRRVYVKIMGEYLAE